MAKHVTIKRNMVRFLLPKVGQACIYDDANLRRVSRYAYLAKAWKDNEPVYLDIFKRFDKDMRRELGDRFNRYALLRRWNFQQPARCVFSTDPCDTALDKMAKAVEDGVRSDYFAPEDFGEFIVAAAQRGDTMKQVLALLREPPAKPDEDAIPYLGDHPMYEQTIRLAAKDRIALNVGNTWHRAEPGETEEQALPG